MFGKISIHWFGPTSMLAAFIAGLAFALGHHVFNNSLNDEEVPQGNYTISSYKSGISKQESYLTAGTAFAFAVRTCLVIAISTAYVQLFWRALATQLCNRSFTLENVDKAYSALRNATLLANFSGWRSFPMMFAIALIAWYVFGHRSITSRD